MKKIDLLFFDAGGGHRSAANALKEVIERQHRPWRISLVNLQEQLDELDVFRKVTGLRLEDCYNLLLNKGWTLGSPQLTRGMQWIIRLYHSRQVRVLEKVWRERQPDLLVSVVPNLNRAIFDSARNAVPGTPLVTILTDIARSLDTQLISICGKNEKLAEKLRMLPRSTPMFVEGFTRQVPYYMRLADFFIGKPGPGSLSEALAMKLPVIVERNAWTLPQERYNAVWITDKGVGLVLPNFRGIAAAVAELLEPGNYARYRAAAEAQNNRAVFEIPDMLATILEKL